MATVQQWEAKSQLFGRHRGTNCSGLIMFPGKVGSQDRLGSDPIWEGDLIGMRENANCRPSSKIIENVASSQKWQPNTVQTH
jgi:hypothetical protein